MKWTIKKIESAARRCKTRNKFQLRYKTAYEKALVMGMLDTLFGPKLPSKPVNVMGTGKGRYWTEERLVETAKQYKTRMEFRHAEPGAYMAAYKYGLLDKICHHMVRRRTVYTKTSPNVKLIEFAARSSASVSEFQKQHSGAYMQAFRAGMMPDLFRKEE